MHAQIPRCSCSGRASELHNVPSTSRHCYGRVPAYPVGVPARLTGVQKQSCSVGPLRATEGMSLTKPTWCGQLDQQLPPPLISKGDSEFLQLGVEFVEGQEGISTADLNSLFVKVGFPKRDPDRLAVALTNTHRIIWIKCTKQTRYGRIGELVGFARATSDGVFSATIWDVAVAPVWQRSGLGRALIERLTKQLVEDGIATITLYAEPQVVGLYRKLGFVDDPEGVKGMAFQRKKKNKQQTLVTKVAQAA